MISIWMVCHFLLVLVRHLRALAAALGIADEVDRLGLKGSKKKKSKKLDEDWMVMVVSNSFLYGTEAHAFTANTQTSGS